MKQWIEEISNLCCPDRVHFCDGSEKEFFQIAALLEENGGFIPLKRPKSWLARSAPEDVARLEAQTYICSLRQHDAGPTNHWKDPKNMKNRLQKLFSGSMRGRVMYVIPFLLGPGMDSPFDRWGIEITDSPYVVCNMHIMTRVQPMPEGVDFVKGVHSVGAPLISGQQDVPWPCNAEKWIVHFPEIREIWSYGSGYGGNALLSKKCFALRIASVMGKEEGWLAEHMLILGITNPEGKKKYFAAAFPSACGKTNLATLQPSIPGWKIECVGDDIAWMHFGSDGKLYGVNPESGFFGIASGVSDRSGPVLMKMIERDTIFTNAALLPSGDVWWNGLTKEPPEGIIDWHGKLWNKNFNYPPANLNARFTVPITRCPILDKDYRKPSGVPIQAILFGGRRKDVMPLVVESFDWTEGVLLGASLSSEKTYAAEGKIGVLRNDPFAMLPFCGYNMGDYFRHWLSLGKAPGRKLPKIFFINPFRTDSNGNYIWPGFGENIRVLEWIFQRIEETEDGEETPMGWVPKKLNLQGLSMTSHDLSRVLRVNSEDVLSNIQMLESYFSIFHRSFPEDLSVKLQEWKRRC